VEGGLRERKKQRTRETIVRAALDLFAEKGYDATTVAEIAEASDISPRTFFGYFPTKEDVVFHDHEELMREFVRRMRERPPGEQALVTLRTWILEMTDHFEQVEERERRRLVQSTPSLVVRERTNLAEVEQVLAAAIADDLAVDEHALRPHLVSAAAIAALMEIGRRRDVAPAEGNASEAIDEALEFARGGLEALRAL
jgi:AcrR family transcriptional regulator